MSDDEPDDDINTDEPHIRGIRVLPFHKDNVTDTEKSRDIRELNDAIHAARRELLETKMEAERYRITLERMAAKQKCTIDDLLRKWTTSGKSHDVR